LKGSGYAEFQQRKKIPGVQESKKKISDSRARKVRGRKKETAEAGIDGRLGRKGGSMRKIEGGGVKSDSAY